MRICLLCPQPPGEPRSAAILCGQLAEGLRQKGYVVKAFAPRKGWQRGHLLRRFLREIGAIPLLVWRGFRTPRYDMIVAYLPPLTMGLTALMLGLLWRAPVIVWVQDLGSEIAQNTGVVRNPILLSLTRLVERIIYRQAARIVVIGQGFIAPVVKAGAKQESIRVIPNWADAHGWAWTGEVRLVGKAWAGGHGVG